MARPLRPIDLFATLNAHHVRYVVIGGMAAVLHGSPTVTSDSDICPERSPKNLERLANALREMHARIRTATDPDGIEFAPDAALLSRMKMMNFTTDFGDFDLSFTPAGFAGFEELVDQSVEVLLPGTAVKVAALDDVITSKEVANRPKDHATLPILYALRDRMAEQERNE